MTEPLPELEAALQHVAAPWDEARTARSLQAAQRKRAARRLRAGVIAGAAAACMLAAAVYAAVLLQPSAQLADAGWRPSLELADGSRAFVRDDRSQVVVARVASGLTELTLLRGSARFDVTPNPERRFRVRAGDVVVQVLGTAFEVERSAAGTHVAVTRGRVAVSWPAGSTELGAGEARWFPSTRPAQSPIAATGTQPSPTSLDAPAAEPQPAAANPGSAKPARATQAASWRQHAEQGDFKRAYALLENERTRVADDVEELLLAADAARLSGHASEALPFLRKVVELHAADPRAPLAAFTLGGVLMNQLGRPREAEAAYRHARDLAPRGSLAQDALAREVEAAHRADDPARARALALEYLERHPDGRRVEAVRRFGGLP
jgi:transmembrane sensor